MPLSRPRLPLISLEPCLPSLAKAPPTGPDWIHEIKHDGFRVIARRDGKKVRLISRKGKDLTYRFPQAAAAVAKLPVHSCLIDGEAIVCHGEGLAVCQFIRSYRRGHIATLCAFDLIEIDGEDLRWQPIEARKAALKNVMVAYVLSEIASTSGSGGHHCESGICDEVETPQYSACVHSKVMGHDSGRRHSPCRNAAGGSVRERQACGFSIHGQRRARSGIDGRLKFSQGGSIMRKMGTRSLADLVRMAETLGIRAQKP